MVNKERVALIPAALRKMKEDGTLVYVKGQGFLHNLRNSSWCCLGAASAEAAAHGLPLRREEGEIYGVPCEIFGEGGDKGMKSAYVLCAEVMEWYGFEFSDPALLTPEGVRVAASWWNDYGPGNEGPEAGFDSIADAFERTYLQEAADG